MSGNIIEVEGALLELPQLAGVLPAIIVLAFANGFPVFDADLAS